MGVVLGAPDSRAWSTDPPSMGGLGKGAAFVGDATTPRAARYSPLGKLIDSGATRGAPTSSWTWA